MMMIMNYDNDSGGYYDDHDDDRDYDGEDDFSFTFLYR